jgi:lambda repressor-like predicted transcriptional regulator
VAALHVAALIEALHPGVAVRDLERAAGLPVNTMANYLKPGRAPLERLPRPKTLQQFASALGCDVAEVVAAFAADLGLPWSGPSLTPEDSADLRVMRALHPEDRVNLRKIAKAIRDARSRGGREIVED